MVNPGISPGVCDDTSGRMLRDANKTCDHYALIKKSVTIYRHKNRKPKP